MRRRLLCVAALFAPAASSAQLPPWNPRAPENAQLRPAYNVANVEEVLAAIGAKAVRASQIPGRPLVSVTFANGRRAVISLLSCNPEGTACRALGIQASWVIPAGAPPARLASGIETFNRRYSFAKAFVSANGRATLQRYLTGDYGHLRGDLAVNLQVFSAQADRFMNDVIRPLARP